MRFRTDFAELMTYLILWSVIKHAHCKTSRESVVRNTVLSKHQL